eukprot:m.32023 g.32023  ORF g.32023 m.32023 type:complete len:157 (+) comp8371_c0_seq1:153-623(+)
MNKEDNAKNTTKGIGKRKRVQDVEQNQGKKRAESKYLVSYAAVRNCAKQLHPNVALSVDDVDILQRVCQNALETMRTALLASVKPQDVKQKKVVTLDDFNIASQNLPSLPLLDMSRSMQSRVCVLQGEQKSLNPLFQEDEQRESEKGWNLELFENG